MLASFQCRMPLHHLIEGEDIDHLLERKLNVVTHLQIEEFVKLHYYNHQQTSWSGDQEVWHEVSEP